MNTIKLKVCGMREAGNIAELTKIGPDYMGFIFYRESKRFVGSIDPDLIRSLPVDIKATGVFVNEQLPVIAAAIIEFKLAAVQLHSAETPELCESLKIQFPDVELIKAFGVDESFNFELLNNYERTVDYFLFDTKTEQHGGSGRSFDWEKLKQYAGEKPYFLSGGIGLEQLSAIKA
ncbi:MAG: phosphoribosylanthranilate isomerase, partial [Pedobacter sp.]